MHMCVAARKPGFYKTGSLLNIGGCVYVFTDEATVELTGKSMEILCANNLCGLDLRADNAEEYLVFFCENLAGDEGRFIITGPSEMIGEGEEGFRFRSIVRYAGHMFAAEFFLTRDGRVEMIDDDPIGPVN